MSDIERDAVRHVEPPSRSARTAQGLQNGAEHRGERDDPLLPALEQHLAALRFASADAASRASALERLCARGFDQLPRPGEGRTALRWSALAAVAACDLALVKLYEGHTDAQAILAELHAPALAAHGRWGVWAAEPPHCKVTATPAGGAALRLEGTKPWCSGAATLTHALVTVWRYGEPVLAAVELAQPSIEIAQDGWHAVGMAATGTSEVQFHDACAMQIGDPGAYLARPGFWQGGAGIAACWYGCAAALASVLRANVARRMEPHACAHLGAADAELAAAGALLRETAAWIDRYPRADCTPRAMRARLAVERAATAVIGHVTRALGAGPLCGDRWFARAVADLPVFLRQSHGQRDEAALGRTLLDEQDPPWRLDCA